MPWLAGWLAGKRAGKLAGELACPLGCLTATPKLTVATLAIITAQAGTTSKGYIGGCGDHGDASNNRDVKEGRS